MTRSTKLEDQFIQTYLAPLASAEGAFGLKDDAAQINVAADRSIVISTDTLVEGVHFFAEDPPETLARKLIRVNMSDLIAKGADATGYFLSLGMPDAIKNDADWINAFVSGLQSDQDQYQISLFGGDTVRSPEGIQLSMTIVGDVAKDSMVRRTGARPGDRLFVTGLIGSGVLGLLARKQSILGDLSTVPEEHALIEHLPSAELEQLEQYYLVPDISFAAAPLVQQFASASMDVSDGLVQDAQSLAQASGVGFNILAGQIPHPIKSPDPLQRSKMLQGGDDYQVLMTVAESRLGQFQDECASRKVLVAEIGRAVSAKQVVFVDSSDLELSLEMGGFDHFR